MDHLQRVVSFFNVYCKTIHSPEVFIITGKLKTYIMKTENLTIVITGASNEIGRAAAIEFAKKGHNVALSSRNKEALDDLARECRAFGADTFEHQVNMSVQSEVNEFTRQVYGKFGTVDVWINNALNPASDALDQAPTDDLKNVLDANVLGYLYGARAALDHFRKQGHGKLINVSVNAHGVSQPFSMAYATSRAAIKEMTAQLQQETEMHEDIHIMLVSSDASPDASADSPDTRTQAIVSQIVQLVDKPEQQILQEHDEAQEEAEINHRVRNIFWIGVAVASVVAGAAAIYYRNNDKPLMTFDQIKGKLMPFINHFYNA
jgi:NADP-dependent 3-hydroxy acid dehydrogenase YdfG